VRSEFFGSVCYDKTLGIYMYVNLKSGGNLTGSGFQLSRTKQKDNIIHRTFERKI
jgi:hypothetical protein